MRHIVLKLFLLSGLLKVSFCQFKAFYPSYLRTVKGSCVYIPCTFTLPPSVDIHLDGTCGVIWSHVVAPGLTVGEFDSRYTRDENIVFGRLKGNVVGNLLEKNCSTILEDVSQLKGIKELRFRLECNNTLRFSFRESVRFEFQDDQPPVVDFPQLVQVEEGTALNLSCKAPVFCPTSPPLLTWGPQLGPVTQMVKADASALMNFKAMYYLHNDVEVKCSAFYKGQERPNGFIQGAWRLRVLFAPKILTYSCSQDIGNWTQCSCVSKANPPPRIQWQLFGVFVNNTYERLIGYDSLDLTTRRSSILLQPLDGDDVLESLVCFSTNQLGVTSYAFGISSPAAQKNVTILVLSVMKGVVVFLLYVLLLMYIYRCIKSRGNSEASRGQAQNTADSRVNNENNQVDTVYYNVDTEAAGGDGQLHFPHVNVTEQLH
ncbi:sialic acid-binding Ig-like lectin 10 [Corythoichthys intestinalis]|uniref:sialic acid-binding Ig-like lectin 10 n=1 Tax=Corythoichthys intestinalis TaxID=161448 RepID=UPI0025A54709|nr:sialic acid-binding Ig-like lectin 10 [Corythoichthys intestinalis]XP_057689467.1 sialic acid-binding Ig-like lectin 10 [Corythoichthys intestinalis]XP_057689468.1 sialic acid-binding Ig-like lectin 10 [Corythoichthys intestinalis]